MTTMTTPVSPAAAVTKGDAHDVPIPALIVFGLDDGGKAHASWFVEAEADLALKAAGLMGMGALRVTSDEHRLAVSTLPRGRVFASGRAFVPFAKMAAYDRLNAFGGHALAEAPKGPPKAKLEGPGGGAADAPTAGTGATATASGEAQPLPETGYGEPHMPTTWSEVKLGSHVLAPESDNASWWPAIVISGKGMERFTLRWRDDFDEPSFTRTLGQLGLFHPASAKK